MHSSVGHALHREKEQAGRSALPHHHGGRVPPNDLKNQRSLTPFRLCSTVFKDGKTVRASGRQKDQLSLNFWPTEFSVSSSVDNLLIIE